MDAQVLDRQFRAPREHGQLMVEPTWNSLPEVLLNNREQLRARRESVGQGVTWGAFVRDARRDLWERATHYTRQYRDVDLPTAYESNRPLIVSGHQPELFHPGVWIKQLALGRLASALSAGPVQLLIDNDTIARPQITVPTGTAEKPSSVTLPLDQAAAAVPHEQRPVRDTALFASFGRRIGAALGQLIEDPLAIALWSKLGRIDQDANLGRTVARLRHQLEEEWGYHTLELPLSEVCDSEPFHRFAAWLLAHPPELHAAYNSALDDYRAANRVRNAAQPLPNLARDGDWHEVPFWLWSDEQPQRRRVYARVAGRSVELSDREHLNSLLPLNQDADSAGAVEVLAEWRQRGAKLRPRAGDNHVLPIGAQRSVYPWHRRCEIRSGDRSHYRASVGSTRSGVSHVDSHRAPTDRLRECAPQSAEATQAAVARVSISPGEARRAQLGNKSLGSGQARLA